MRIWTHPWISRKSSAITLGPLSIGFPDPLNTLPSMSSDTGVRRMSPVNSHVVFFASIPDVPSKTCTTALDPVTSRTWPALCEPSGSFKFTISANLGNLTLSRITRGPLTPDTVLKRNYWTFSYNFSVKCHVRIQWLSVIAVWQHWRHKILNWNGLGYFNTIKLRYH